MARPSYNRRIRKRRLEGNYSPFPSMIGHDPYGADKNTLAQLDEEIARLEMEELETNLDLKLRLAIEELVEENNDEVSERQYWYKESRSDWRFNTYGLLEFLFQVFGLQDIFYHKRQAEISSRKNILIKLRDSLRSKISRAFVVPNIRSKLQKILKPLFRRCVGEEPIKFFTYENKVINLIVFNHENQKRIYTNYRLAS